MNRSHRSMAGLAVLVWSSVFAAVHLYWALGGRAGLGDTASSADQALSRPVFAAYNLIVVFLSVVGAGLALAVINGWISRPIRSLLTLASGVLLVRGALGVFLLLAEETPVGDAEYPLLLVLAEPWFLLGAVSFAWLNLSSRESELKPTSVPQPCS